MKLSARLFLVVLALSLTVAPAAATFRGQNGKIVFVGNQSGTWQLYTINPDGSDMDKITDLPPTLWVNWYPAFSPDGKRIAFGHDTPAHPCETTTILPSGCADLYIVNADGTGLAQLTHDGLSFYPRWSPDGTRIVFSRLQALTNQTVIATMPVDGNGERTTLTSEFWNSYGGTYTPDGRQIIFDSDLDGFTSVAWSMKGDGSGQRRFTPPQLYAAASDVSPDGLHVLLASYSFNTPINSALYVADLDGRHIRQLTHDDNANENFGGYSPDGKRIVFQSNRLNSPANYDLFTMNADGSKITRIASGLTVGGCGFGCVFPSWGPKPKQ